MNAYVIFALTVPIHKFKKNVAASALSAGRVRGHRDDGAERAVRAEVQLPPADVPRHGLPLGHGGTSKRFHVCFLLIYKKLSMSDRWYPS